MTQQNKSRYHQRCARMLSTYTGESYQKCIQTISPESILKLPKDKIIPVEILSDWKKSGYYSNGKRIDTGWPDQFVPNLFALAYGKQSGKLDVYEGGQIEKGMSVTLGFNDGPNFDAAFEYVIKHLTVKNPVTSRQRAFGLLNHWTHQVIWLAVYVEQGYGKNNFGPLDKFIKQNKTISYNLDSQEISAVETAEKMAFGSIQNMNFLRTLRFMEEFDPDRVVDKNTIKTKNWFLEETNGNWTLQTK